MKIQPETSKSPYPTLAKAVAVGAVLAASALASCQQQQQQQRTAGEPVQVVSGEQVPQVEPGGIK